MKMRSIILILSIAIFVLSIICGLNIFGSGLFRNKEITRYDSLGKYTAVVFIRDAGATTDFSYQIAIIKKGTKLPNKVGNIFICEYNNWHENNINVKWVNNKNVKIWYEEKGITIFKKINKIKNIDIEYN